MPYLNGFLSHISHPVCSTCSDNKFVFILWFLLNFDTSLSLICLSMFECFFPEFCLKLFPMRNFISFFIDYHSGCQLLNDSYVNTHLMLKSRNLSPGPLLHITHIYYINSFQEKMSDFHVVSLLKAVCCAKVFNFQMIMRNFWPVCRGSNAVCWMRQKVNTTHNPKRCG